MEEAQKLADLMTLPAEMEVKACRQRPVGPDVKSIALKENKAKVGLLSDLGSDKDSGVESVCALLLPLPSRPPQGPPSPWRRPAPDRPDSGRTTAGSSGGGRPLTQAAGRPAGPPVPLLARQTFQLLRSASRPAGGQRPGQTPNGPGTQPHIVALFCRRQKRLA